ncbi:MAG: cytochrome b [Gammaproteobacteria bacterium]|nr:cytochrome b [Gammaproteobacteria bacterium]
MTLRNTTTEFGSLAKALHWLVAIGLFTLLYLGLEQAGMERGPEKSEIRFIHASIAMGVFALMTIRIIWRFVNEVPAHPDGMAAWQQLSASVVHWGLYVAVFVQLISGGMTVATGGKSLPFFGIFSIPLPVAENEDKHHFWEEVHEFAWRIVALLIVAHILGAIYNHFIAKNDAMRRMTVGLK